MSIWDTYPNLSASNLQTLVAVTAQVLLESDAGNAGFPPDLLQRSTAASARELEPLLRQVDPTITRQKVQNMLEDQQLATQVCRAVLDQVRAYPELAERVAQAYEARNQKMTGFELILLSGALVILATKIKRIRLGSLSIDFEPAGKAVTTLAAGLAKGAATQI